MLIKNRGVEGLDPDFKLTCTFEKSITNEEGLYIEGYANTIDKDRYGDIVLPSAFEMSNFNKNPVILLQHSASQAIGRMVDYKIDDKGLWIKVYISKAAEDLYKVHTLVNDGVLRAFSIGFRLLEGKYLPKEDTFVITQLELLEVSVVAVPANQESLFSISKSFKDFINNARLEAKTNEESQQNLSQLKREEINMTKDSNDKSTPITPDEGVKDITADVAKMVSEQLEKAKKEAEVKAKADEKEVARLKAEKEAQEAAISEAVKVALKAQREEDLKNAGIATDTTIEYQSTQLSDTDKSKYEKTLDDLYLLSIGLGKDISELKAFKALPEVVQKTVTNTGGVSLAPIGFDKRLIEDLRKLLVIEKLFPSFNMPLSDFRLPFNAGGVVAEFIASPGTAPADRTVTVNNVLYTAKKLMTQVGFNYEDEDDAVVALLPTIRKEIAYAMANLIDTTLVSGDGTGGSFRGISHYAASGAGGNFVTTIAGGAAADFTPADVAAARSNMGRYGIKPRDVALLINLTDYYKLVDDTTVQTVTNFGPQATLKTGELASIWGVPIIPTEAIAAPAATGDLRAMLVRSDRFKTGYYKSMDVEAYKDPRNQTRSLISSMRLDFNPLVPLTAGQLAAGQEFVVNINVAI